MRYYISDLKSKHILLSTRHLCMHECVVLQNMSHGSNGDMQEAAVTSRVRGWWPITHLLIRNTVESAEGLVSRPQNPIHKQKLVPITPVFQHDSLTHDLHIFRQMQCVAIDQLFSENNPLLLQNENHLDWCWQSAVMHDVTTNHEARTPHKYKHSYCACAWWGVLIT